MPSKSPKITVKSLSALLTRIGSTSSGSKAVLRQRFGHDIRTSRLFGLRPEWATRQIQPSGRKLRIMSIDMGIKNLAFCDTEVEYPIKDSLNTTMKIHGWEKVDLANGESADKWDVQTTRETEIEGDMEDTDMYSSSALSATAYKLVKNTILNSKPDIILIEKQRWRSGGGSAVLQWTVRVNTLEAMLWAVLTTLRAEHRLLLQTSRKREPNNDIKIPDFEVFAVDPKRVGQYWLGQSGLMDEEEGVQETKKLSKSKAEKKARIEILRSWLSSKPASSNTRTTLSSRTTKTSPTITFEISEKAEPTRKALCFPSKPTRRSSSKQTKKLAEAEEDVAIPDAGLKKLDDVTDCFLQAAAWVSWESNRLQLQHVRERKGRKGGTRSKKDALLEEDMEISDEVLEEMTREVMDAG